MLIDYEAAGTGDTVVLLHSGVADRRMWDAQWPALTAAYHVVRVDLRGFGASPLPSEAYTDAADVIAVLDELKAPHASIVGSSLGGRVALEIAAAYPQRVERLLLLCPAYRAGFETAEAAAFEAAESHLIESGNIDAAVELNLRWLGPDAGEDARSLVRTMQRQAFEVQVEAYERDEPPAPETIAVVPAEIATPARIVTGSHDMDQFRMIASTLVAEMPAARLHELPWAGHLPSLERPDEISQLIMEFLESPH